MRNIIYILTFLITASQITAASIVAMEKITNLSDGSGYEKNTISFDISSKYPIKQITETFTVDSSGINTNSTKKSEFVGDHIIVKLQDGVSLDKLKKLNQKNDTFIRRKLMATNTFLVGINEVRIDSVRTIEKLYSAATNIVEHAEPDYKVKFQDTIPNDTFFLSHQWGKQKVQCPAAWDLESGTGGVIVAVIDTGVDYNHPDLASNIWVNPGETGIDSNGVNMATNGIDDDANGFIDDVHGWDFYSNDNDPIDGYGHGTKCSGHVGAIGNNGLGVAGVCWNIKIMALKFTSGSAVGYLSDALECFSYVAMMNEKNINVRITNNSWIDNASTIFENTIREQRDLGILCIAAAGNDRRNIDTYPVYPACFDLDNVISVGGSDSNDIFYVLSLVSGSNYGVTNVDLAAPAKIVVSTGTNGTYGTGNGTSYAAPMIAGAAALIWEKAPHLSHQEVFQAIMDGTDSVTNMQGKSVSGGRLNVYKALRRIPYGGVIHIK